MSLEWKEEIVPRNPEGPMWVGNCPYCGNQVMRDGEEADQFKQEHTEECGPAVMAWLIEAHRTEHASNGSGPENPEETSVTPKKRTKKA
jgi:hypothetical protein